MAAAIAEGLRWFDCRVEAAPVVYAALEGEAGFKLTRPSMEAHKGRTLPAGLNMLLQTVQADRPTGHKTLPPWCLLVLWCFSIR
ncbi:MAG: hypothetical protein IPH54_22445 [Rhodoferax sp.]|nr:hypothetical protein [Rhodoferax sp.]